MQQIQTDEERAHESDDRRLALHVRRRRQWYRQGQLDQAQLASIAGLSGRQVRSYERCRKLPAAIDALLAIAIALEVSIEDLIAPHLIAEKTCAIEGRRRNSDGIGSANSQR